MKIEPVKKYKKPLYAALAAVSLLSGCEKEVATNGVAPAPPEEMDYIVRLDNGGTETLAEPVQITGTVITTAETEEETEAESETETESVTEAVTTADVIYTDITTTAQRADFMGTVPMVTEPEDDYFELDGDVAFEPDETTRLEGGVAVEEDETFLNMDVLSAVLSEINPECCEYTASRLDTDDMSVRVFTVEPNILVCFTCDMNCNEDYFASIAKDGAIEKTDFGYLAKGTSGENEYHFVMIRCEDGQMFTSKDLSPVADFLAERGII